MPRRRPRPAVSTEPGPPTLMRDWVDGVDTEGQLRTRRVALLVCPGGEGHAGEVGGICRCARAIPTEVERWRMRDADDIERWRVRKAGASDV